MKSTFLQLFLYLLLALTSYLANAQSTPAEFAEMSLQELFELNIDSKQEENSSPPKWTLSYQYKYAEFDGYLNDDSSLSFDEVLWSGSSELRTDKNFPIVPTVIKQQAHLFSLGYQYSDIISFHVALPVIKQATDHISSVPNYDEFLLETSGFGDTVLSVNYKFVNEDEHKWWFGLGVSFPTGSIDEVGDTPREPGDQQLPYTMQLGSGTVDLPIEFNYQHLGNHDFSLRLSAMLRTGSNDRNYRLGNNYRISGKYQLVLSNVVYFFVGSEFQYSSRIQGRDDTLLVDAPIPYPAGITNAAFYGGRKVSLKSGLSWRLDEKFKLNIELSKPVYQHLNGPQPKEVWRSSVQISRVF